VRLRDALLLFGALLAGGLLFVLWTEHAFSRGYETASYECEYEVST
jgi:hypothetical protein